MRKKVLLITAAIALFVMPVLAGPGTTSVDILKIPSGARSQALGGAYLAVCDDMEAMDINPAGLGFIRKHEVMTVLDFYLQDVFYTGVYYGHELEEAGAIGLLVKYLSAGTITETLENQAGEYAGTGEERSGSNYLIGLGYGINLGKITYSDFTKNIEIGIALKFSGESLQAEQDYSNTAISGDIGAIYTTVIEAEDFMANRGEFKVNKLGFGITLRNIGTSFSSGATPVSAGFGSYVQMLHAGLRGSRLRVLADFDYSAANSINIRGGIEYLMNFNTANFSVRAGGNFSPEQRLASGFALGTGIGLKEGEMKYSVDYVFMPFEELGTSHKIGLTLNF